MSYRLLHYSDPHFGASDPAIAEAAISMAETLAPDLTVISGDFSMRGRRFEFKLARDWLERLREPHICFPGNHDVPGLNNLSDRFFSPFRRYRKYISAIEEPTVKLGDVGSLATANSSTPFGLHLDWSIGFLSPFQTQSLGEFYSALPPTQLRILGMHHPVVGSGEKARALVAPMPLVESFFAASQIDLVLAGHFHQSRICLFPGHSDPASARYLTVVSQAPSICSTRLKGEPNGFHLITLDLDRITIQLYRWESNSFVPKHFETFHRGPGGWTHQSSE